METVSTFLDFDSILQLLSAGLTHCKIELLLMEDHLASLTLACSVILMHTVVFSKQQTLVCYLFFMMLLLPAKVLRIFHFAIAHLEFEGQCCTQKQDRQAWFGC